MPSIIQSVSVTESTGPVTTIVMPSNVTAGNLLVVMIGNPGGGDLGATFADTQSSTFALQVNQTNVNGTQSSCDIWTAPINSSGPETITRTVSSSNYPVSIWVIEVDIPNPVVDSTTVGTADGGTGVTSGNVFTANSNVLLVGAASDNTGNAFDSASPSGSTTAFVSPNGAFLAKFVSSGTYACTFNKSSGGVRYSVVAALISGGNTELVSDSESLSDAVGQGRGYLFSEGISLSESAANDTTGAVPTSITISGSDFISLVDHVAVQFGIKTPPVRGNIDYDQIRISARSGDGAKLHTLTGSITTGHGVVFDANGNLVDSGSAPGGGGTVSSVDLSVPTGFTISGNPVTTSGTLAIGLSTETANTVWAGPTTGSPATPTFRAVVAADLPLGSSSAFGAVKVDNTTITAAAGVISTTASSPYTAPPTVASLTWVNQSTSTATDASNGIFLTQPFGATQYIAALVQTAPGTPWIFTVAIQTLVFAVNYNSYGITIHDGTKHTALRVQYNNAVGVSFQLDDWTSATVYSASLLAGTAFSMLPLPIWLRVNDNGTNVIWSYSADGINFIQLFSRGRTTFQTPTKFGICSVAQSTTSNVNLTCLSWKVT